MGRLIHQPKRLVYLFIPPLHPSTHFLISLSFHFHPPIYSFSYLLICLSSHFPIYLSTHFLIFHIHKSKPAHMNINDPNGIPAPIPYLDAENMTMDYRNKVGTPGVTKLIQYDFNGFIRMLETMKLYTASTVLPSPYVWRLGICPMHYVDENDVTRLVISMLPSIINSANASDVHDFFESKAANDTYWQYFDDLQQKFQAGTGNTFVFDEGNVWP